jgi:LmbE family N-acetylglucosaminyl deacetylase
MMAGTLLLLRRAGWSVHMMNLANGSCGTTTLPAPQIVAIREREARASAAIVGATYHPGLVNDIEVFYQDGLIRRVTAVLRNARPDVLLLPSPQDYMEDHMITARIGATAAFCRGMRNYSSIPEVDAVSHDVTLYHALPYALADGLCRRIRPDLCVDVSGVIEQKSRMLACHASQRDWLDRSQGLGSYVETMKAMSLEVGEMAGIRGFAEGWRRHSHLGYSAASMDPLADALGGLACAPAAPGD